MKITPTHLAGVLIIQPKIFRDSRGYFFEGYQQARYAEHGIPPFVQDNYSHSRRDVVRGLHYQLPNAQGKLVGVTQGTVWDVVVDIRRSSPTFGQSLQVVLNAEDHTQLYIPPGFAHGFCVLSETADFYYKCTEPYHPSSEHGIIWNDTHLNIPWPVKTPIVSDKDNTFPALNEIVDEHLFS